MLRKKNKKVDNNWEVRRMEKFNYKAEDYVIERSFACYWNKAKNEITIKSFILFSVLINTVSFGRLAMFLFGGGYF